MKRSTLLFIFCLFFLIYFRSFLGFCENIIIGYPPITDIFPVQAMALHISSNLRWWFYDEWVLFELILKMVKAHIYAWPQKLFLGVHACVFMGNRAERTLLSLRVIKLIHGSFSHIPPDCPFQFLCFAHFVWWGILVLFLLLNFFPFWVFRLFNFLLFSVFAFAFFYLRKVHLFPPIFWFAERVFLPNIALNPLITKGLAIKRSFSKCIFHWRNTFSLNPGLHLPFSSNPWFSVDELMQILLVKWCRIFILNSFCGFVIAGIDWLT